MDEIYMIEALKQANKAFKKGDVPVGCVIVYNNKIIAKAYNKKEKNKNAVLHAEIIAITKACKKLKTWHLENCKLYTTMEPCLMCTGAIIQSRIGYICYGVKNDSFGGLNQINSNKVIIKSNILKDKSEQLLKEFFKLKRN